MKNINDFTFYATCPTENGIQIRQARFLDFSIDVRFIKFWNGENALFAPFYGEGKIEIAGLGTFEPYDLMHKTKNTLYFSFEGAKKQDVTQRVFTYDYFRYYEKQVNLCPFEISHFDVCRAIGSFGVPNYEKSCYGNNYTTKVYIWNGVKAQDVEISSLDKEIRLDMCDGNARLVTTFVQGREPKSNTKFYKTIKECTEDNYIEVFTFG